MRGDFKSGLLSMSQRLLNICDTPRPVDQKEAACVDAEWIPLNRITRIVREVTCSKWWYKMYIILPDRDRGVWLYSSIGIHTERESDLCKVRKLLPLKRISIRLIRR